MVPVTNDPPLFWLIIVKGTLRLVCFVHYARMIRKPIGYSQIFDWFVNLLLIGVFLFLDFVLNKLCSHFTQLRRISTRFCLRKRTTKLHKKFGKDKKTLLEGKDNQLQELKTKLNQVESQLVTKTEAVNVAEANIKVLRNLIGEARIEQNIIVDANKSLQKSIDLSEIKLEELKSEIEAKSKAVVAAEANVSVLRNLFGESLIEQETTLEENRKLHALLQSSNMKIKELEYELDTKMKGATVAKANVLECKNLLSEKDNQV